jgi:hypothetical protein
MKRWATNLNLQRYAAPGRAIERRAALVNLLIYDTRSRLQRVAHLAEKTLSQTRLPLLPGAEDARGHERHRP